MCKLGSFYSLSFKINFRSEFNNTLGVTRLGGSGSTLQSFSASHKKDFHFDP